MMSSNSPYQSQPTPSLASVLETLAQLAPPNPKYGSTSEPPRAPAFVQRGYGPDEAFAGSSNTAVSMGNHLISTTAEAQPADPRLQAQAISRTASATRMPAHNLAHSRSVTPSSVTHAKFGVDPSTITEWPAALKYVMKTVSQSEELQTKIKKLIRTQHEHERQWWAGREALGAQQMIVKEGKTSEGRAVTSNSSSSSEADTAELSRYDAKVYKAQTVMAKAMDGELRGLGIPFFAIKHELVLASPDQKEGSWVLERDELVKQQRRILELLEDLCNE